MSARKTRVVAGCIGWIGIATAVALGQAGSKAVSSGVSDDPDDPKTLAAMAKARHLIVPANAEKLTYHRGVHGTVSAAYLVHEPYPAKQTIGKIGEQLRKLGWSELEDDCLTPGPPLHRAPAWSDEFAEGDSIPPNFYWQWSAQWMDKRGAVIDYTLRYGPLKNRKGKRELLSVSGIWYGPAAVKQIRAEFGLGPVK